MFGKSEVITPKEDNSKPKFGKDVKPHLGRSVCIRFYLYKSESTKVPSKEEISTFTKNGITACFSELPHVINGMQKTYNRMVYIFGNNTSCTPYEQRVEWIDISIKNHALPSYILESDIKENKYVFQLDEKNLSPSLIYIYLTTIRVMSEEPGFVENMLALIKNYHMSYYLAWMFASKISHNNSNHNLLPVARNSGIVDDINKIKGLNLRYALGLKAYLSDPYRFDKRSVYSGERNNIFRILEESLSKYKIKKPTYDGYDNKDACSVSSTYLLSDTVEKLMNANNSQEVNSIIRIIKQDS